MQSPLFTIVVPAYNRANFIAITLDSFLQQSFEAWELIVVDDGSTDNTDEVVGRYTDSRISYFKKQNEERAVARNYGAARARGKYVTFFDSDDYALENHLEEGVKCIEELGEVEVFHLRFRWETADKKIIEDNREIPDLANEQLHDSNFLGCSGVFVRRDIFLQHQFNEDRKLSASEDWELWLRLAARYPIHVRPTITNVLVDHDARSVRTIDAQALIVRKKMMLKYAFEDPEVKRVYGKYESAMKAKANLYIALHLALTGKHKIAVITQTLSAIFAHPPLVKKRMFLGTIKHWFITW